MNPPDGGVTTMEIAIDDKDVCDLKSELKKIAVVLKRMRRYRAGEIEASTKIIKWILISSRTEREVLLMVSKLHESLHEESLSTNLTRSWLFLTMLEGVSRRPGLDLDHWSCVVQCLISLEDFETYLESYSPLYIIRVIKSNVSSVIWVNLWDWIIDVVCSEKLCPYPYLRLELFILGRVFNKNIITYYTAPRIMDGLVNIFGSMNNCDELYAAAEDDDDKLYSALVHILPLLKWSKVRDHLIKEIVSDMRYLIWPTNNFELCGRHICFFVNLLKLIGKSADISKMKYKSDGNKLRKILNQCLLIFILGISNLTDFNTFTMSEFHAVYRHPMVLPSTMNALTSISDAFLFLSGLINSRPEEILVVSKDKRIETDEIFRKKKCQRLILLNKLLMRHDFIINVLGLHETKKCFTHSLVKREIHGCKSGFRNIFENKACQQIMFSSDKLRLSCRDVGSAFDFKVRIDENSSDEDNDSELGSEDSDIFSNYEEYAERIEIDEDMEN